MASRVIIGKLRVGMSSPRGIMSYFCLLMFCKGMPCDKILMLPLKFNLNFESNPKNINFWMLWIPIDYKEPVL